MVAYCNREILACFQPVTLDTGSNLKKATWSATELMHGTTTWMRGFKKTGYLLRGFLTFAQIAF